MKDNYQRITEYRIVEKALKRLRRNDSLTICCEVPSLGRSIDLVLMRDGVLIAIEFKLRDWRRGIRQARDYRLGADFSYICMPCRKVSEEMKEEFINAGVGLMFYDDSGEWPFQEVIEAPKSWEIWPSARDKVCSYVIERHKSESTCQLNSR